MLQQNWKIILSIAALIFSISFAFKVFYQIKNDRISLKIRLAEFASHSTDRAIYGAKDAAIDAFGTKEEDSLKELVRNMFK